MREDGLKIIREWNHEKRIFENTTITGTYKNNLFFVKYEGRIRECFLTESSDVKYNDMIKVKFTDSEETADFFLEDLYLNKEEIII